MCIHSVAAVMGWWKETEKNCVWIIITNVCLKRNLARSRCCIKRLRFHLNLKTISHIYIHGICHWFYLSDCISQCLRSFNLLIMSSINERILTYWHTLAEIILIKRVGGVLISCMQSIAYCCKLSHSIQIEDQWDA